MQLINLRSTDGSCVAWRSEAPPGKLIPAQLDEQRKRGWCNSSVGVIAKLLVRFFTTDITLNHRSDRFAIRHGAAIVSINAGDLRLHGS